MCVMRTKNYTSSPWSQSCIAVVSVHLVPVRCGSHHRRGNAASRAKKRQLHGPLCKPTCHSIACATLVRHVSSSEAIRGVLARWPKHSQTFWSPRTNDRQLPEQRPQVAPVHEGQGVQGKCVLFASGLPGEPPHHACPLAVVACHRGATQHTMVVSMATWAPTTHRQTVDHHLQSASIQSIRRWDVHVTDHQICAHSSANFSADACHDAFESISSSTKHSRLCTCCSMVATRIKWTATSAACVLREGGLGEADEAPPLGTNGTGWSSPCWSVSQ